MKFNFAIICIVFILSGCNNSTFFAEGTVVSIENGKDGYSAIIKSKEGKDIHFTASRVDMGATYTRVKMGDKVRVYGDSSNYSGQAHVHAKKIQQ